MSKLLSSTVCHTYGEDCIEALCQFVLMSLLPVGYTQIIITLSNRPQLLLIFYGFVLSNCECRSEVHKPDSSFGVQNVRVVGYTGVLGQCSHFTVFFFFSPILFFSKKGFIMPWPKLSWYFNIIIAKAIVVQPLAFTVFGRDCPNVIFLHLKLLLRFWSGVSNVCDDVRVRMLVDMIFLLLQQEVSNVL